MLKILPGKSKFIENAKTGKIYPVYAELPFMPPQQIFEFMEAPNSFLLESIKGPEKISRYSFIGAEPFLIFKVKNGVVEISRSNKKTLSSKAPLKKLRDLMQAYQVNAQIGIPPFAGGAVGIISYDFVHYLERLPRTAIDDLEIPDAHIMLIDTVIAIDHKLRKMFLISCPAAREIVSGTGGRNKNWGAYYESACEKIHKLYKKIDSFPFDHMGNKDRPSKALKTNKSKTRIRIHHEMSKKDYMNMVKKTKEYIRAGDIFQANLSQRVSADIGNISAWKIYKTLSRINPSPFAGYLNMNDYHIVSSSPERLVRVNGDAVETRPIAGTRPRGMDAEGDRQMRADLLLNEKERAEHLMLIDLERNDLGRISDYSTVEADELMITEEYSHVIHIVSNIKGTIVNGKDCFDAIKATFPGGTITGVPKVRCMEIIDELEPVARGPYTGSIGYISFTGAMDLNIIIRTFVIKDSFAYVQAGAGIVADSDPEREYHETLKKAEALIKTLEVL
jgi:anthranilate/para-aminobenzoate synthase component I